MQANTLTGGFAEPPHDAARAFRAVMKVMARPGQIEALTGAEPPAPMSVAAGTLALTVLDGNTPVYLAGALDCKDVRDWITFHTGAPFTGPAHAVFAFGGWDDLLPLKTYPIGNPEYPDRGSTLVVEMPALEIAGTTLSGPGIKDKAALNLPDPAAFQANAIQFPLGLDFFFTSGDRIAALPRSTKVEAA